MDAWISFFAGVAYREEKTTKEKAIQRIERMIKKFKECIYREDNALFFDPSSHEMCYLPYDDDVKALKLLVDLLKEVK